MPLLGRFRDRRVIRAGYRTTPPGAVSASHNPLKREAERVNSQSSLTASGERLTEQNASYIRRLVQAWQIRAFGYYDIVPEIKFAGQFYARSLQDLELFVGELDEKGEYVKTEDPDAVAALDRIKDPGGTGRANLLASFGRLMFLVGEALLFVSKNAGTELEQWEMLSTDELRVIDGGIITRFMAPSLPAANFREIPQDEYEVVDDETAMVYRLWRRHPRFSQLPDSTMMGVLELCEELVLLTQAVRARARSRLAGAGVLFIDDRISPPPPSAATDDDPLVDRFQEDLTDAMVSPIVNEGEAGAVVPLLARVSVPEGAKLVDLIYHLQIVDPMQIYPETGLRMECIKRIAIGLDMPSEILLGITDANHWTAWMVDEQSWKAHLQPVAQQLVEDLTTVYLGPILKKAGRKDWTRFAILYDATAIINHPDRGADAKDVFDRGELSGEALRTATGFDPEDAPTESERATFIGIKTHDSSLAWEGIPSVRTGGIEVAPGVISTGQDPVAPPANEGTQQSGGAVEPGPPPQKDSPAQESVIGSAADVYRIVGGADFAVLRLREAVGNRLRTLSRRDQDALAMIDGAKGGEVAAKLGRVRVRQFASTDDALLAGGRDLVLDALRMYGLDDPDTVALIADQIERHVVRTMFDVKPTPLPASFADYVAGILKANRG